MIRTAGLVLSVIAVTAVFLMPALASAAESVKATSAESQARLRLCPSPERSRTNFEDMFDTELQRMAPARIFDNFYMLGMKTVTAWALTTAEGIILFDAMLHYNVEETVVESLRQLNLDPADVRYVIISHAHNDHFGGARYLQETFGAKIVMSADDWEHMKTWPQLGSPAPLPRQDIAVRDGDTITLGDTTVNLVVTPGHTPGTLSPVFPVKDAGRTHYVGYWGGAAMSFLPPEKIIEYRESAVRFAMIDKRIDVPLSNHPFIDGSLSKTALLKKRGRNDAHPFVEGNAAFRDWMSAIHDCAGEVLEQKLQEAEGN